MKIVAEKGCHLTLGVTLGCILLKLHKKEAETVSEIIKLLE